MQSHSNLSAWLLYGKSVRDFEAWWVALPIVNIDYYSIRLLDRSYPRPYPKVQFYFLILHQEGAGHYSMKN